MKIKIHVSENALNCALLAITAAKQAAKQQRQDTTKPAEQRKLARDVEFSMEGFLMALEQGLKAAS